ncbi:GNAT family N-acetyltransferase [Hymenobacter sp. ASUV-10]|uniref:GNAT family N-acetyltransferase n=1 Tax=Hymenobacter aranciens TaxID=3063996 RepID=A0ABT9BD52_9BACT|nr:GNAT family N-acetyltransferase [Hymenobacter sp. ASUV-10]MDO7876179.1 GNAT family N-acetyltransferase [Hymenobacter sp. ASUV-10]
MKNEFTLTRLTELDGGAKERLLDLWNTEYPEKLSHNREEFEIYLQRLDRAMHLLLVNEPGVIGGWAVAFDREAERWFVIILSEALKGQGWGRKMLDELKQTESVLNGWVIDHDCDRKKDGQPYKSPLEFYEKCGFAVLHDTRLELEKISAVKIKWTDGEQVVTRKPRQ